MPNPAAEAATECLERARYLRALAESYSRDGHRTDFDALALHWEVRARDLAPSPAARV